MTFKLTQEQTETIQAVFDNQRPGKYDYDCWEGINKQLQTTDESRIRINEEGKEELVIFYMEKRGERTPFFLYRYPLSKIMNILNNFKFMKKYMKGCTIEKVKVHRD